MPWWKHIHRVTNIKKPKQFSNKWQTVCNIVTSVSLCQCVKPDCRNTWNVSKINIIIVQLQVNCTAIGVTMVSSANLWLEYYWLHHTNTITHLVHKFKMCIMQDSWFTFMWHCDSVSHKESVWWWFYGKAFSATCLHHFFASLWLGVRATDWLGLVWLA